MKRSIMAVIALMISTACNDVEGPDLPRQQGPAEQFLLAKNRVVTSTADMAARSWFDIEIDVDGFLKPESAIELTVRYTANFATADADLSVTLPEVEYAKLSAWDHAYKTPVGLRVPAKVNTSLGFSAGQETQQTTVFSVNASGIYRILATAESEKIRPDDVEQRVQPTSHETVWILVTESGGRVLDEFDPALVPDGLYPQPGPFREIATGDPKPSGDALGANRAHDSGSCPSNKVCIKFVYYDNDLSESKELRGLFHEWEIVGDIEGFEGESGSGRTDSQGRIQVACPDFSLEGSGTVSFDDAKARIIPRTDHDFSWGHGDCGDEFEVTLPSREGRTWVNAWHTIRNSEQRFVSRRKMRIQVNPPGETACGYLPEPDVIRVIQNDFRRCIWGSYGLFVLPHEFGHALHEKALGGVAAIDTSCAIHWPYTEEKLGCAYNEGWADYFAYEARPTVFGSSIPWHSDYTAEKFENNHYYESGRDGARYSGIIMAFFWDLSDGTSESHDSLELDQADVTDVMSRCKVREGSALISPSGIDHLIWCLEAQVDADVTGGDDYFTTRSPDPTDQNQSDHAWDEDDVRTLWLKNLYNVDG